MDDSRSGRNEPSVSMYLRARAGVRRQVLGGAEAEQAQCSSTQCTGGGCTHSAFPSAPPESTGSWQVTQSVWHSCVLPVRNSP